MIQSALSSQQRNLILYLWASYGLFYLGRFNLSVAVPDIADALDVSRAQVGILGTVFLWTYAAGQVVNGQLGNLISPRRLVALGLSVIAVCNILFGFQNALLPMAILWGIDGVAQSMGWGPTLRIVAENLSLEQRARISTLFPMNIPVGTAFTWLVIGLFITLGGWRWAFWGGGLALVGVLIVWWLSGVDAPTARTPNGASSFQWSDMRDEILLLAPAFIISGFVGYVNLSAVFWIPTFVKDTELFPESLIGAVSGFLPLTGVIGMLLSAYLMRRLRRVMLALMILQGLVVLSYVFATIPIYTVQLLCLTIAMLVSGGSVGMVLSAVPITLAGEGRASSAAGLSTALYSVAGGLGSYLTGVVVEEFTWGHVFGMWSILTLLAAGIAWTARHREG